MMDPNGDVGSHRCRQLLTKIAQILDRAEKQLQSVGVGNWNYLDKVAWELVQNWYVLSGMPM